MYARPNSLSFTVSELIIRRDFLVYATVTSGSLSILATGIDSVFDIGSNLLLFYIHRKSSRLDHNKWPVGGSRLETIGDIAYGG